MSKFNNNLLTVGIKEAIRAMIPKKKSSAKNQKVKSKKGSTALYKVVSAPAAVGLRYSNPRPVVNGKDGVMRICHRELVDSVVAGSATWTQQGNILINAGNSESFPWLSGVAINYEFYRFNYLAYTYIPICGSTTTGSYQMAPDFNASDGAPTSELIFNSYQGFVDTNVWMKSKCVVDAKSLNRFAQWHYVSDQNTFGMSTNPIYDAAQFFIYTNNCANTNGIGKLYVEYEVELKTPTLPPSGNVIGGAWNSTNPSNADPLQYAVIAGTTTPIGVSLLAPASDGHTHLIFNAPGTYLLDLVAVASGGTVSSLGSIVAITTSGSTITQQELSTLSSATVIGVYSVVINSALDYISWTGVSNTGTLMRTAAYVAAAPPASL